ncbi:patatin-like phospholipase family protein [Exilibacterium tricleocarpae]|uniref:Patatin-like phospholipase family protein n=1 Tax=Exilibacterium tricleocarpae TaxID=2591008 RepID=A0A545TLM0_9GAMM|nr:patatin-like phospholipase family protein [Exilibacterium tricleocarpae]TQV78135.1 patatin-like phospholipase family protein [Exilibacterium tricleocarpae]
MTQAEASELPDSETNTSKGALILSGGGARAAYQVGVLTALNELLPASAHNPFPIICGTSAGAINALALATHAGKFSDAVDDLHNIWENIEIEKIFRTGWRDLSRGIARMVFSLFNQGVGRTPIALLDNTPLWEFLRTTIDFDNIDVAVAEGDLEAVCVTAMGYTSGESVSFFQGRPDLAGWRRYRRVGRPTRLTVDHLIASAAIPTIFPTVCIDREYYGDGAMRQLAPISPALHLGADRVFVIGVSSNRNPAQWGKRRVPPRHSPSIAQIIGHMFNSAFIDSLEGDIEHLDRVNDLLEMISEEDRLAAGMPLRPVKSLVISPSRELDKIAGRKIRYLPKSMRFFMRSTGATASGGGAAAASYLLFAKSFCNELIELGYQDAMWEKDTITEFFEI